MPLAVLLWFSPWISDARFSILIIRKCPQDQTDLLSAYDGVQVCRIFANIKQRAHQQTWSRWASLFEYFCGGLQHR